jgi:beta-mannanase
VRLHHRRRTLTRVRIAGIVAAALAAGCVIGTSQALAATSPTCTLSAKEVPSCGVLWGAYKPKASGETWQTAVTDLESQVGRKFDIAYRYQDFSTGSSAAFPDSYEQALAASGHILLADWAAKNFSTGAQIPWASIANGSYDASVIDPEAQRVKSYGKPIMISFDHEMDSRVGTSQGTAANYVAAYRHIHDEFARLGVTNVIWVWTVTGSSTHDSQYASLYPGNSYVDWVGFDPYNFYNCHSAGHSWRSFDKVISQPYQWLESNGFGVKPFILPEYGTVANPSDSTAAASWYNQLPSTLKNYPNIKAMLQWDDQTGACNTQLTASTGELAAFAAAGKTSSLLSHLN